MICLNRVITEEFKIEPDDSTDETVLQEEQNEFDTDDNFELPLAV